MEKRHPYADAAYRVVPQPGKTFGVEVSVPDAHPAKITSFASKTDAEAWIAKHKQLVLRGPVNRRWMKKGSRSAKAVPATPSSARLP